MRVSLEQAKALGWLSKLDDRPSLIEETISQLVKPNSKTNMVKSISSKKPNKREIEGQEQAELIAWLHMDYPDIAHLMIHIPNGGSRKNAFEGWRLKMQGVRKGVSDLFFAYPVGEYHGLWIEFKAAPPNNATVTPEQQAWLGLMREQGYRASLCLGVEEAKAVIQNYLESI
jgi:hypothetical protein